MATQAPHVMAARVLRQARLARGESLETVAGRTRIHVQYLEALENDSPPRAFPSPIYARLFLRTYARYLGLEEEPLVEAFGLRHGA